ncbi:Protein of unknown function [Pyronema omphalodes CBS 100304]|uniref:Uncharacterized protein n=1 Tax=Pyronema omphalodes (strain CBS 100304) TaxID=1076935 RepID=U4KWU1_PYROM|nr:Protein of unknown function [Pyronema omphalodes CBS 100304]
MGVSDDRYARLSRNQNKTASRFDAEFQNI